MQIKRYEAGSIQEALTRIKKEMGDNAIILSTKRLKGGKIPLLEVTAARDEGEKDFTTREHGELQNGGNQVGGRADLDVIRGDLDEMKSLIRGLRREETLAKEVSRLKEYLDNLMDVIGTWEKNLFPGPPSKLYCRLVANGVSREMAYRLANAVNKIDSFDNTVKSLEDTIIKSIPVSNAKKRKGVIAFVGPTGVGKTTTLAKLAAHYAMSKKLGVGLISADTYRIGAADQLRTYAKIMGLQIKIVSEKEDFRRALSRFSDRDVVLVDTPGKSRNDAGYMEKLRDLLNVGIPVETNLLLSLTSNRRNMLDDASRFGMVNYDNIIFTKVDEGTSFGSMYDVIDQVGKPVSYLTNGQNVPNDIEEANPHRIARLIMYQS